MWIFNFGSTQWIVYNAWYMKGIWKLQYEFADAKIN